MSLSFQKSPIRLLTLENLQQCFWFTTALGSMWLVLLMEMYTCCRASGTETEDFGFCVYTVVAVGDSIPVLHEPHFAAFSSLSIPSRYPSNRRGWLSMAEHLHRSCWWRRRGLRRWLFDSECSAFWETRGKNQTVIDSVSRNPYKKHVSVKPRRPPMTNTDHKTALRHDHLQAFPKKVNISWGQKSVDAIKPV